MQKIILLLFVFTFSIHNSYSQINVGKKVKNWKNLKELSSSDFSKIKSTFTYFVYDESFFSEKFTKEEYEEVLNNIWTLTDFKVVTRIEFYETVKVGDSAFLFNYSVCSNTSMNGGSVSSSGEYVCDPRIELSIISEITTKKGKLNITFDRFSEISVQPFSDSDRFEHGIKPRLKLDLEMRLRESLGVFSHEILFVNNKLENSQTFLPGISDFVKKEELKNLKTSILYITEEVVSNCESSKYPQDYPKSLKRFISYKKFRRNLDKNILAINEDYKFEIKFISEDELSEKILNKNKEQFYYIRKFNNFSIIRIIDNLSGDIVFRRYKQLARKLNAKFIKNLNEAIETGKI